MPDTDPWQSAFDRIQPATAAATPTPAPTPASDPWNSAFTRIQSPQSQSAPTPANDPWSTALNRIQGASQSPVNGQTQQSDQNEGLLKKTWDWANTPLTSSVMGWNTSRQGAGGFEKGFENFLSGFTSPLSVALTIGTFGTGGLLESGGAAALREAGMSAADIATVEKGAQAVAGAVKTGKPITAAIEASGADPAIVNKGLTLLHASGLSPAEITDKTLTNTLGSKLFRGLGVPAAKAPLVARGVQTLVDAGFTYQNVHGAMQAYPVLTDALKDAADAEARGDTVTAQADQDRAHELLVSFIGGGAFGLMGLSHAFHDAGIYSENVGRKLRPSDNSRRVEGTLDKYDENKAVGYNEAQNFDSDLDKLLGKTTPERRGAIYRNIEAGGDEELLKARHDYLVQAAGLDKPLLGSKYSAPIPLAGQDAMNARAAGLNFEDHSEHGGFSVSDPRWPSTKVFVDSADSERAPELPTQRLRQTLRDAGVPEEQVLTVGAFRHPEGIPDNVDDLVRRQIVKDQYKPAEALALVNKYEAATNLTPLEKEVRDRVSKHLSDMFTYAAVNDVVHAGVHNYITHIWDLGAGPNAVEPANRLVYEARSGKFSTDAGSIAKQRVFDSSFEGELLGHKLKVDDPIAIAAHYTGKIKEIVAGRELVDQIIDSDIRGDDGQPMAVYTGVTTYKEGPNGENPATAFFNPNAVRRQNIDPKVVADLKKTGLLDKFIADGKVAEIRTGRENQPVTMAPAPITYTTDNNGTKWAETADSPAKVTVPGRLTDSAEIEKYAREKLNEQIAFQQARNGPVAHWEMPLHAQPEPIYKWTGRGFVDLDHSSFRDWTLASHTPEGQKTFVRADVKFHPQFADYVKTRLGLDKSAIRNNPVGKLALEGGGEAKHLLLSFSPFHMFQEGLRAVMTGIAPWGVPRIDLARDEDARLLVNKGMTGLTKSYNDLQQFTEGVSGKSKIISKIPVLGAANDEFTSFLFDRYIPALKLRAGKKLMLDYARAHPDWTRERVAEEAAAHANEAFGGINWRRMGRSATQQDIFRLVSLAPDWLESELRFTKRLFTGDGTVARRQVAAMALGLWGVARVLNYLNTGQGHYEAPFGVAVKDADGREKIYSMRTLPTDILHMASDPVGFLKGRESPLLRTGQEVLTGRNEYGEKLTPGGIFADATRNLLPIGAQGFLRQVTNPSQQLGSVDQGIKAAGATVNVYKTQAQQMAAQLASNRSEQGPVNGPALAVHQAKMEIEDRVRSGQIGLPQLHQMVTDGAISPEEQKQIVADVKGTQGMDPDMASLYLRANKLPMKDFLSVYDAAGLEERTALTKLLLKKKNSYFKNALKNMTPDQRRADPVYNRLTQMFPSGIISTGP